MLSKLRAFASLYRELGPRWTLFRLAYALRLRTGLIRLQMPKGEWGDYKHLLAAKSPQGERSDERSSRHVVEARELPENVPWDKQQAIDEADRLLNGEIKYFSHHFIKTDFPPDWHADHVTLSHASSEESLPPHASTSSAPPPLSAMKHWSQISHDHVVARRAKPNEAISTYNEETASAKSRSASQRHYDIKFVWEPNRFSFIHTLVRAYAVSQDEKYPAAFWTLIEDWAQHNPPNTGPNWMDGQEIALRLMAWMFGYHTFLASPSTTPERKENFVLYVAAQAERIYKNIGYAISTRSNHTISEAYGLWMVGLLFPELKHAKKYLSLGKKLLEQEAVNQIFPDGSYSMYSLNYHRFILHIYLYAIRFGELNDMSLREGSSSEAYRDPAKQSPTRFSDNVYQAVTQSITYLSFLIDPQTGKMPVYGSNDGALVLPLNNCDFTDYRPLLQLGWYITKGERLFGLGPWDEDVYWLTGEIAGRVASGSRYVPSELLDQRHIETREETKTLSFPYGGVYLLRSTNSHALIRCTDFTSRPSHADQLHVDLWIYGHNLAIDAGTCLYSGAGHWRNGLAHTSVHNTVTVDNKDQMTMLSRFTWTNWSKGKVLKQDKEVWQGEHDGYKPVSHKRTVMALEGDRWLVIDNLNAKESHHYALHWLLNDYLFEHNGNSILLFLDDMKYKLQLGMLNGDGGLSIVRADPASTRGWRSRYYGHKEPAISVMLEADLPQVTFWSFFGFEEDVVEIMGDTLKLNSETIQL